MYSKRFFAVLTLGISCTVASVVLIDQNKKANLQSQTQLASESYECLPLTPPEPPGPPTPAPNLELDPVRSEIRTMEALGVSDIDGTLAAKGQFGAYEVFKCNCALDYLNQKFYAYEIPPNLPVNSDSKCAADRAYYDSALQALPSVYRNIRSSAWIKQEAEANPNVPPPFEKTCMKYVMNLSETSHALCSDPKGMPQSGAPKPCVSPTYVNSIYNIFTDMFSCLEIPQKEMVAKMMVESSFHANTFVPIQPAEKIALIKSSKGDDQVKVVRWTTKKDSRGVPLVNSESKKPILIYHFKNLMDEGKKNYTEVGGDAGVGQLTGDAIAEVNRTLPAALARIAKGSHPACQRLRSLLKYMNQHSPQTAEVKMSVKAIRFTRNSKGLYEPLSKDDKGYPKPRAESSAEDTVSLNGRAKIANRCDLISPPEGLVKNILYTAVHAENIADEVRDQVLKKGALVMLYELFGGADQALIQKHRNLMDRKNDIKRKFNRKVKDFLERYPEMDPEALTQLRADFTKQLRDDQAVLNKEFDELSKQTEGPIDALGKFKLKDFYKILAVQAYNAGPNATSNSLVTYLQARYDAFREGNRSALLTIDDFNFWTSSSHFRDYQCPYVSNFEDIRDPCLPIFDAVKNGFSQFLRSCQRGGGRGYAAVVAHRVKKINKVIAEGQCSPKSFLTLCGEEKSVVCDEKGNCRCSN